MDFKIIRNDITNMKVDAVVLPANSRLWEGSGTSHAIYEKAGRKELKNACKKYGKVDVGASVPTSGFNLEAKYILHTVVPKWRGGMHNEYTLLCASYLSALHLADEMKCESIAFPLLSSGNNGFDLLLAYDIARKCMEEYVAKKKLREVYLVVYNMEVISMLEKLGVHVDELIDDQYVLEKDESYKLPVQNALKEGKEIGKKLVGDAFNMAKEYLDDPENRRQILEMSAKIVAEIVKKSKKK